MFDLPMRLAGAWGLYARETYAEFGPVQPDIPGSWLESRYTNEASAFLALDGARIHYRDEGPADAPTLLALHGVYSSLHTWEGWAERLTDDHRLVRLDLPGFGLTGPTEGGYSVPRYIETVAAFCDALGLDEVSLAGNSLGGAIAWRFAARHPDRVERLLLLDSGGRRIVPEGTEALLQPGADVVPRYLTPRTTTRRILRDAYGDPDRLTDRQVRRYHDLLCRAGNRRAVIELARTAEPAAVDPGSVEAPTLVGWGGADEWIPPSFGRELAAEIPDSEFSRYEGVGHIPMEEAPAPTAADAAAFLSRR
jgi:pimeloyl-ACP methyl ester carboxylesterase